MMKSDLQIITSDLGKLLYVSRAQEKLALLRIHKTASQSFRKAFRKCYRHDDDARLNFALDVTFEKIENKRFVSPHMTVQQWFDLGVEDDWKIAVTFREPRKRLRSAFRYFQQKPNTHPTSIGAVLQGMSYRAFLTSDDPSVLGVKDNIIAKFLGGGTFENANKLRNQVTLSKDITIQKATDTACSLLSSGKILPLVVEEASASITSVCEVLGVRRLPKMPWSNSNKKWDETQYTEEIIELENAFLKYDFTVYDCAVSALNA